jgi:hypothetical protein
VSTFDTRERSIRLLTWHPCLDFGRLRGLTTNNTDAVVVMTAGTYILAWHALVQRAAFIASTPRHKTSMHISQWLGKLCRYRDAVRQGKRLPARTTPMGYVSELMYRLPRPSCHPACYNTRLVNRFLFNGPMCWSTGVTFSRGQIRWVIRFALSLCPRPGSAVYVSPLASRTRKSAPAQRSIIPTRGSLSASATLKNVFSVFRAQTPRRDPTKHPRSQASGSSSAV